MEVENVLEVIQSFADDEYSKGFSLLMQHAAALARRGYKEKARGIRDAVDELKLKYNQKSFKEKIDNCNNKNNALSFIDLNDNKIRREDLLLSTSSENKINDISFEIINRNKGELAYISNVSSINIVGKASESEEYCKKVALYLSNKCYLNLYEVDMISILCSDNKLEILDGLIDI